MNAASRAGGMGEVADVAGPYEVAPFGTELARLASMDPSIVAVSADMSRYSDLQPFLAAHPDRYFAAGMAEQSAISMSAGMAKVGKTVFCATYAAFLIRRALDFIAVACAHSGLDVKVFAGAPGLVNPYGATHQSLEDLVVMRGIPDVTVIDPCDAVELRQVVQAAATTPGTFYVRNLRGKVPVILDEDTYRFRVGEARVLREGTDVAVVSTGYLTGRALLAADRARGKGISVTVVHVPTIKPLDKDTIREACAGARRVVTLENGLRTGGLGSAVTEVLHDAGLGQRVMRVGLGDRFHPCGSQDYNELRFGLSQEAVDRVVLENTWAFT